MAASDSGRAPWTFALDHDGDLILTDLNTFDRIAGQDAITQDLKVALKTIRGEDRRDAGFGLALFSAVRSEQSLRRELRRAIEYDDFRHDRIEAVTGIDIRRPRGARENVEVFITYRLADDATTSQATEGTFRMTVGGTR